MSPTVTSEIAEGIIQFFKESTATRTHDIYVGITNDVERRLFNEHNVDKNQRDNWVYFKAFSADQARLVESVLIEKADFDGGEGGGGEDCVFVYAFLKTPNTKR